MCHEFGFQDKFFDQLGLEFGQEAVYGMHLNISRLRSVIGAQFFKSKFYLDVMGFNIDDDICDALSNDSESKRQVADWYSDNYIKRDTWRNQER